MEIISFVSDSASSRRVTIPRLRTPKNLGNGFAALNLGSRPVNPFGTAVKTFNVKKVSGPFNPKGFLIELGHSVSETSAILADNSAKLALIAFISVAAILAGFGIYKTYDYLNNFTGPIAIQKSDEIGLDKLNKLMNDFALESPGDVDESGNISGSDVKTYEPILASRYSVPVTFKTYKVQSGDTISGIAKKFGLTNVSTLISVNDIGNVRQLAAGQKLKIPSIDGIIYTVKSGDSLAGIVEKNKISLKQLLDVNDLSSEVLQAGQQLFLPGAALDQKTLKIAMGDRFILPISAKFRWSSPFGWRDDPIAHVKSFHTGTDMACPTGTPILASMSGKVITTGINRVYGNYVIIDHGNGYQTLYAHMSKIIASKGQWVSQGTRIGLVGSTGYSTGPHLHFTVYKNGKMINPVTVLK